MKTPAIVILISLLSIAFFGFAQDQQNASGLPAPIIKFENPEFDFGKIEQGEKVSHVFKLTNVGNAPLIISSAKGSCGCTVPFFPTVPIMPGEQTEIEVEFDSKGKTGVQSKRVAILANTEPSTSMLAISGVVLAADEDGALEDVSESTGADRIKDKQALEALDPNCFAIFPNPTNETLQLELKEHIGQTAMVHIRNEKGTLMLSKKIDRISRESTRFDVSHFSPGIYLITISINEIKPQTQCFIVTGH